MVLNYMHFFGIIWFVKELVVLCKVSDIPYKLYICSYLYKRSCVYINMPIWIIFLHSFTAAFFPVCLGIVLSNIEIDFKKLFFVSFLYATLAIYIKSFPWPFGLNFILLTIILILMVRMVWSLTIIQATIITVLGTFIMLLGEAFFLNIILELLNTSFAELIKNTLILAIFPLPQIIFISLIIIIVNKSRFSLFNFNTKENFEINTLDKKRLSIIIFIFVFILLLMFIQTISNFVIFNIYPFEVNFISVHNLGLIVNIFFILIILLIGSLVKQLIELTEKENQLIIQSSYVETFDELYTAIREQRHDIINHFQTIYGFNQIGLIDESQNYIQEMLGNDILSKDLVLTSNPGLSALLFIKSGLAIAEEIDFNLEIKSQLNDMPIPAYDLNRIIGNLINNAFEAVANLKPEERIVCLTIFEDSEKYKFMLENFGYIDKITQEKIFTKGYSSKIGEHGGLGLYIVSKLVDKYSGNISLFSSKEENIIKFELAIPKINKGGNNNEFNS